MEHRKFQQRLNELVAELTYAQAQKVIAALPQRGDGEEAQRLLEQRLEDAPECAHCGSRRIEGWGRERNGLKRCRCLDCRRTFNALTGTPLARLRKKERWLSFAGTLNESLSVRKAARACKVNKNTAFKWRHRFLKAQNQSKDQDSIRRYSRARKFVPASGSSAAPKYDLDEFVNNDVKQAMARKPAPKSKDELKQGLPSYIRGLQKRPDKVNHYRLTPVASDPCLSRY